jgi:hypothetical protein
MKRILLTTMGLAIMLALAITLMSRGPGYEVLDTVDINTDTINGVVSCGGCCSSFNIEMPGSWGAEYGFGAVTAFPGDAYKEGYVTLDPCTGAGKVVRIRHLDGIADDSFDLSVKNVRGAWTKVGHYTDKAPGSTSDTETWIITSFDLTWDVSGKRVNLAEGRTIEIMIDPTALGWWGYGTYGQLAIDYVELLGQGR